MAGWLLEDPSTPQHKVVGLLSEVKPGSPHGSGDDGDTGFMIRPTRPFYYVLKNKDDQWNADVKIECEINVWPQLRSEHGNWIDSMSSSHITTLGEVTAVGVWVEDTGHNNKTELHPVDVVFGRVESSLIAEDWLNDLIVNENLKIGISLYLFRFAIATDVRAFFPFDDQSSGRPPLAGVTRPVTFTSDFPPPPSTLVGIREPAWRIRRAVTHGTILDTQTAVRSDCGNKVLDITITPQSLTDAEFDAQTTSDQGAAVLLGEFVTYWGPHSAHT
jgi:hypothetical protein